jgi:hypothetical protein
METNTTLASLKTRKSRANSSLYNIGKTYHTGVPVDLVNTILIEQGFNRLEDGIYTGREGRSVEPVGEETTLCMTWYKMPSGRYEIVAYVS